MGQGDGPGSHTGPARPTALIAPPAARSRCERGAIAIGEMLHHRHLPGTLVLLPARCRRGVRPSRVTLVPRKLAETRQALLNDTPCMRRSRMVMKSACAHPF